MMGTFHADGKSELDETYRIVALGLKEGVERETALSQLAALFKTGADKVAPMLTGERVSIKKGLDAQAAARYQQALDRAGLRTALMPEQAAAPAPAAPAPSHFASDPGRITLSEARLFKLTPELDNPNEALETRRALIGSTAEHLREGDARAAVVIDAAKGIVAAYTDEMDCAVLLRFDRAFAINERWQDGTRLLTVNRYGFKQDGMAPDLQVAPGAVTEFGNVIPLIADLLTEDRQALDAAKARIGEAEWLRAQALGQALWRKGVTPREGRPLWSGKPVAATPALVAAEMAAMMAMEQPADEIGLESALKAIGGGLVSLFFLVGFARSLVGKPVGQMYFFSCFVIVAMAGTFVYCARRVARWMSQ
jgi:hypothetical protein